MSADNAIYFKQCKSKWYVLHGGASQVYCDSEFIKLGRLCASRSECLEVARQMEEELGLVEYGIVEGCFVESKWECDEDEECCDEPA